MFTISHGISAFIKPVQLKNMVGHKSWSEFLTYLRDIIRKVKIFCKIPSFSSNKYESPEEHTCGCIANEWKKRGSVKISYNFGSSKLVIRNGDVVLIWRTRRILVLVYCVQVAENSSILPILIQIFFLSHLLLRNDSGF